MSARPSACRAGSTASATTAICCSSTCATITASPRSWRTRNRRCSPRPRRAPERRRHRSPARWWPARTETVNPNLPTGEVEVRHRGLRRAVRTAELPLPVFGDRDYPEETRLHYRFLDLRRESLHQNIMLRQAIIASIRERMSEAGFIEFQTPILTASSPEGARDYLVPTPPASRQVLRAAAGAAAVQAAAHGRGLRPLLPDRAVLPRRGRARRPLARRVLPARPRDDLRHPGRRVRRDRAGPARRVRGIRRRQAGDEAVPAHPLRGSDAQIRHRQAGPAQSDRDGRTSTEPFRGSGFRCSPA